MKHSPQILKTASRCLITLCLLLIVSCEKDINISNLETDITINLNILTTDISLETKSTPSPLDIAENKINRVRIYAFDQESNTLINMVYQENIGAHITTRLTMPLTESTETKFYAIINEPTTNAIQKLLTNVTNTTQLEAIKYKILHYFKNNAGGIFAQGVRIPDFCLPMTGETTIRTTTNNSTVEIPVTRCVSRIDVYLRKDGDLPVQILPTTTIRTRNTAATSFLLDGTRQDEAKGSDFDRRSCLGENAINIPKTTNIPDKSDYTKAFWFYTPEREHDTKKMTYTLTGLQYKNTTFTTNSVPLLAKISPIPRNNIYKVYCTVGNKTVRVDNTGITNWEETQVSANITKPDTLTINKEILTDWLANGKSFIKTIPYSANQDVKLYIGDSITEATPNTELNNGLPWIESAIWTKTDNRNGHITILYKIDHSPQKEIFVIKIKSESITHNLNITYDNGDK